MNNVTQLRPRPNRFATAPRDLVDPAYMAHVADGTIPPDIMAWPAFGGELPRAEDYATRGSAYDLGYAQGFDCQMGGRVVRPTPPIGMPRELLPRFARGVIDGAGCVQQANATARRRCETDDFDPWADLDADLS